jgi:hypothetical protein
VRSRVSEALEKLRECRPRCHLALRQPPLRTETSASVDALSFVTLPVGYSAAQWKPRFSPSRTFFHEREWRASHSSRHRIELTFVQ